MATPLRRLSSKTRHPSPSSARRGAVLASPKITPPRPAQIYEHQRLFHLLDHARAEHRVIWVSAPAGAGKTSLAASYVGARKLPVLWYQVDEGDGDVASFIYYMGLAIKRVAPRYKTHAAIGRRAEALAMYERCRRSLKAGLGIAPSSETTALHLRLVQGRR